MKTLRDYINLVSERNLISEKVTLNPDGTVPPTQTVNGVTMNAPANAVTTGSGGTLTTSDGRAVTSGAPATTPGAINIDVRKIQQDARVKAYQDAIAAGKTEAEAQNAEAAAGNLAGAEALKQQGDAAGLTPTAVATPVAEPTTTATATPPVQGQPAATKQWNKGVLGVGSVGEEVKELQRRLGIPDDGKYGPATRDAVIALQKRLGVTPDGAYGPQTRAAHDKEPKVNGISGPASKTAPATTAPATTAPAPVATQPATTTGQAAQPATTTAPAATSPVPANADKNEPYWVNGTRYEYKGGATTRAGVLPGQWVVTAQPGEKLQWNSTRARSMANYSGPDSQYGKTAPATVQAQPVKEMSKSDAQLLEKMLTIANLR